QRLPTRIDEVVPMPDPWRYRVRAQIVLGVQAGFRERRPKRLVRPTTCPVVHPLIDWLLDQLNRLLRLGQIPDFRGRLLLHAQVVGPEDDRQLQLLFEGVDGLTLNDPEPLRETVEALAGLRHVSAIA